MYHAWKRWSGKQYCRHWSAAWHGSTLCRPVCLNTKDYYSNYDLYFTLGVRCPLPSIEHAQPVPSSTVLDFEDTITVTCMGGYGVTGNPAETSKIVTCGSDRMLTPEFECSGKFVGQASAKSNQSLHCALNRYLRTQCFFMRTAKTLIRLGGCTGHFVGFVMWQVLYKHILWVLPARQFWWVSTILRVSTIYVLMENYR